MMLAKLEEFSEPGSGAVDERFGDMGATLAKELQLVAKVDVGFQ
jgi:hypothetical protein